VTEGFSTLSSWHDALDAAALELARQSVVPAGRARTRPLTWMRNSVAQSFGEGFEHLRITIRVAHPVARQPSRSAHIDKISAAVVTATVDQPTESRVCPNRASVTRPR